MYSDDYDEEDPEYKSDFWLESECGSDLYTNDEDMDDNEAAQVKVLRRGFTQFRGDKKSGVKLYEKFCEKKKI